MTLEHPLVIGQPEIDQYEADLAAHYDALYRKWLRDARCDGTLPAEPVAPVDPGPAGEVPDYTFAATNYGGRLPGGSIAGYQYACST